MVRDPRRRRPDLPQAVVALADFVRLSGHYHAPAIALLLAQPSGSPANRLCRICDTQFFAPNSFSRRGNRPAFSLRHRVTGESCEIVSTSVGREKKTASNRAIKITFHLVITQQRDRGHTKSRCRGVHLLRAQLRGAKPNVLSAPREARTVRTAESPDCSEVNVSGDTPTRIQPRVTVLDTYTKGFVFQ